MEVERTLFRSDVVAVGTFRCPPGHERFAGGWVDEPLVVFPRTTVIIDREGRRSVTADPNTAVFYNADEEYRRVCVDRRGDLCDWFALTPAVATEMTGVGAERSHPFPYTHGPVAAPVYLWQRSVVAALDRDLSEEPSRHPPETAGPDPLQIEETVMGVFAECARQAEQVERPMRPCRPATERSHVATVDGVRAVLAARATERVSLADVAAEVAVSAFHLARMFRRHTGFTVHEYLTQLRLRMALGVVTDPDTDLATLAIELGFSSHSHFTRRFTAAFGMPPSALRGAGGERIAQMRKIVTV